MRLREHREAAYAFRIGARQPGGFVVQQERAEITGQALEHHFFDVKAGELLDASDELRAARKTSDDRLYLTAVSGVSAFRPLYDALVSISAYNINPASVRQTQPHDPGERLDGDGSNLAAVFKRLVDQDHATADRIQAYLRRIMPDIVGVEHLAAGPGETLIFRQRMQQQKDPWRFYASSMSDGTLRSLGVLVALFQGGLRGREPTPLIAIEEPEATIHPGAASTLAEALLEAAAARQIMVTTHSPDLLDHPALAKSTIYSVEKVSGETVIAAVNEASLSAIRDGLYTPGELLRNGQLQPAPHARLAAIRQRNLFESLR